MGLIDPRNSQARGKGARSGRWPAAAALVPALFFLSVRLPGEGLGANGPVPLSASADAATAVVDAPAAGQAALAAPLQRGTPEPVAEPQPADEPLASYTVLPPPRKHATPTPTATPTAVAPSPSPGHPKTQVHVLSDLAAQGRALQDAGHAQEAMQAYLLAVNADATDVEAWRGLARGYQGLGRLDYAHRCWLRVQGLDPADPDAKTALETP